MKRKALLGGIAFFALLGTVADSALYVTSFLMDGVFMAGVVTCAVLLVRAKD